MAARQKALIWNWAHSFIEGFEDQIVGHNIGEEFDINVTFPEAYHAPELAGKAAVFAIKVNGITAKRTARTE